MNWISGFGLQKDGSWRSQATFRVPRKHNFSEGNETYNCLTCVFYRCRHVSNDALRIRWHLCPIHTKATCPVVIQTVCIGCRWCGSINRRGCNSEMPKEELPGTAGATRSDCKNAQASQNRILSWQLFRSCSCMYRYVSVSPKSLSRLT